ncbi:MAG: hypothetical protein Q8R92_01645 [Deltaproteobacteria bacterium]|nr:hypothetical protein [Deltaproteobacteria bacterium]
MIYLAGMPDLRTEPPEPCWGHCAWCPRVLGEFDEGEVVRGALLCGDCAYRDSIGWEDEEMDAHELREMLVEMIEAIEFHAIGLSEGAKKLASGRIEAERIGHQYSDDRMHWLRAFGELDAASREALGRLDATAEMLRVRAESVREELGDERTPAVAATGVR